MMMMMMMVRCLWRLELNYHGPEFEMKGRGLTHITYARKQ